MSGSDLSHAEGDLRCLLGGLGETKVRQQKDPAELAIEAEARTHDWGEMFEPLEARELPPFPVDVFPEWMRDYALAVSERTGNPPCHAAQAALGTVAAAAMNSVEIQFDKDWIMTPNLYVMSAIAEPGSAKSMILKTMTQPLRKWEEKQRDERRDDVNRHNAKQAEAEAEKSALQKLKGKLAASGSDTSEVAMRLERATETLKEGKRAHPLYVLDDFTPQALRICMRDQSTSTMSLVCDEAGNFFSILAGKYSSDGGSDMTLVLNSWAGDPTKSVRVKDMAQIDLPKPLLNIVLMIQPEVLQKVLRAANFSGNGFLDRVVWTASPGPDRMPSDFGEVSSVVKNAYSYRMGTMFAAERPRDEIEVDRIQLTDEARSALRRYFEELGDRGAVGGDLSGHLKGAAAKMRTLVVRAAGLLHFADSDGTPLCGSPWRAPVNHVPVSVVERATRLANYWISHRVAVMVDAAETGEQRGIRRLLGWIGRRHCEEGRAKPLQPGLRFTKQEAWQFVKKGGGSGSVPNTQALDALLQTLADSQYIRPVPDPAPKGTWAVNPGVLCEEYPPKQDKQPTEGDREAATGSPE